ncbi:BZ3500_MvSof-1268-A1-R1_Chr3-1g05659 [Microbotryum saponariae]|uniref:BZ3500_MvSof-1268-A1-R1_Chr3-1g05659 protein n=1 Tax=Microbotryum saponariae TaxID=289078 RepID=A0A2X0L379_9BASI|nr:BZ3500_MvSof-1268-A1-R1_Chr3-1g05659 [Microbotryum saponariae]SDA04849.1 BZ3501_MvSof-1269-A2-R1_Chr3-1g05329 [Microbotryum saponariae]
MSDPADLARKRSRSSSQDGHDPAEPQNGNANHNGGASTSTSNKKANNNTNAPTELTRDDDVEQGEGNDDVKPMVVDSENPSSTSAEPSTSNPAKPAAATAEGDAAAVSAAVIQMRALIVTQDASIIIGKGGKNVNEIRDKSGSKITITETIPGNPERIMVIAGPLDAVSKAFGLIVRRINDEPFETPSVPGSRAVTIRFIIPNARMGSVIGKGGAKIKEIQEASGARLQASEAMLPGSTERVLSVSGVADAIHIAVYYIGTILQEHAGNVLVNTPYRPSVAPPLDPYGAPVPPTGAYGRGPPPPRGYPGFGGPGPHGHGGPPGGGYGGGAAGPGAQTQQIFIPNELVGSIIGKGGAKINEVRQASQCQIKIDEPGGAVAAGGTPAERLVTITGQPAGIQVAVRLLYARLEQEKEKREFSSARSASNLNLY